MPDDADPVERVAASGFFRPEDIGWICDTYFTQGTGLGTPWDRALRDAHMTLPDWFKPGLDPLSEAYVAQQHQLWQLIVGVDRPYEPDVDEKEHGWADIDPVRSPGFFIRRDPQALAAASDHVLATGMFLKHCGLISGDWALEYGAGFGQTALALSRLGVNVDTVDISATFCDFVRRQAAFFEVPLTPFHGHFGTNPRPGQKYKVIWFYESFHHCVDFQRVVHQLREHLAEGGRVILGGEPIVEREYAAVPYPWGVRLHSEVAAVMRKQRWFELGFSEDFLYELFAAAGFTAQRIDCPPTLFGRLYIFERRGHEVDLATQWLPPRLAERWGPAGGQGRRCLRGSVLWLDTATSYRSIEIDLVNRFFSRRRVEVRHGNAKQFFDLAPGEARTVRLDASIKAAKIEFIFHARRVPWAVWLSRRGRRYRGVFVERMRYLP